MALVTQDKSSLFGGVSQQGANVRPEHQVEEMINCLPTLDSGLRVRNPSLPIRLVDVDGILSEPTFPFNNKTVYVYEHDRGNAEEQNNKLAFMITDLGGLEIIDLNFDIDIDDDGLPHYTGVVYRDGQGINYEDDFARHYATSYASKSNFAMTAIKDTVFLANKSIQPTMSDIGNANNIGTLSKDRYYDGFVNIGYDAVISGVTSTVSKTGAGRFNFTVPENVSEVRVCMIGGGGGGSSVRINSAGRLAGGGYAGQQINQVVSVNAGQTYQVVVGKGGLSEWRSDSGGDKDGNKGGTTSFAELSANGGNGGTRLTNVYGGDGRQQFRCYPNSPFNDGSLLRLSEILSNNIAYGGQAGFAKGGQGGYNVYEHTFPTSATKGSGGGGGLSSSKNNGAFGGTGGDGEVRITWSEDLPVDPDEPVRNVMLYERRGFIWVKQANPEFGWKYGAILTIRKQNGTLEYIDCGFTEEIAEDTTAIAAELAALIGDKLGTRANVTWENSIVEIFLTNENELLYDVSAQDSFGNSASYGWSHKADFITDLPQSMGTLTGIVEVGEREGAKIWVEYREGAWVEHHDPRMITEIDATTMPYAIYRRYNNTTERYEFYVERFDWNDRLIGDDGTNRLPQFLNEPIKDIFFFRNRFGIMSENGVSMSEIGYYGNFFRTTVATVLDSDRIDAGIESPNSINLEHAILLEDSVMMFSDKAQFRFRGGDVLSPSSYTITQECAYNVNISVRPLLMNNRIFFVSRQSLRNSAVYEMMISNNANQNSVANEITVQCKQYVDGRVDKLTGSSVNNMLFVTAGVNYDIVNGDILESRNTVYVYNFFDAGNERIQSAWHKWEFAGDIYSGFCMGTGLYLMINRENRITPPAWILSSGLWNNTRGWLMNDGLWLMTPDTLERQKQFEIIPLHAWEEHRTFLDNYNNPVAAVVNLGEWMMGRDGKRSPRGELQFRTVEVDASDKSTVGLIVTDLQRTTSRVIPSNYVKGRQPYIGGKAEDIRVLLTNEQGKGFRIESVSYEGTITKRARST